MHSRSKGAGGCNRDAKGGAKDEEAVAAPTIVRGLRASSSSDGTGREGRAKGSHSRSRVAGGRSSNVKGEGKGRGANEAVAAATIVREEQAAPAAMAKGEEAE